MHSVPEENHHLADSFTWTMVEVFDNLDFNQNQSIN